MLIHPLCPPALYVAAVCALPQIPDKPEAPCGMGVGENKPLRTPASMCLTSVEAAEQTYLITSD